MNEGNKYPMSDDEEDLETLRLAALRSLQKKKQPTKIAEESSAVTLKEPYKFYNGSPKGKQKRGNFFGRGASGRGRNNSNWIRNTNLISIPTISTTENTNDFTLIDQTPNPYKHKDDEAPKLTLPQDRYHKNAIKKECSDINNEEPLSKFDRYNDSDESDDDDSDNELECNFNSDNESNKTEFKRSSSLDALMEELENEIKGETKSNQESIIIKKKKIRRRPIVNNVVQNKIEVESEKKENLQPDDNRKNHFQRRKWLNRQHNRQNRNFSQRDQHQSQQDNNVNIFVVPSAQPLPTEFTPFYNAPPVSQSLPTPYPDGVMYQPIPSFPNAILSNAEVSQQPHLVSTKHVPVYEQPLSPLLINVEPIISTATTSLLAPLSPRSAAFVLENRAIIEKRKQRSYSRSPSPRFRRSKSPKRSLSKSLSPRRRSLSPVDNNSTKNRWNKKRISSPSPPLTLSLTQKSSVYNRLGNKHEALIIDEKKTDPVLEARRKKFENNEITVKEGVIRLKKNDDNDVEEKLVINEINDSKIQKNDNNNKIDKLETTILLEDDVDDAIDLDLSNVDSLFSDDESDSENEGRFKTKQESLKNIEKNKISILPFTKLINNSNCLIDNVKKATDNCKNDNELNTKRRNEKRSSRKRNRSRTPLIPSSKNNTKIKSNKSHNSDNNNDKHRKSTSSTSINEKKIEIKLRNPSKYDVVEIDNGKNGKESSNHKRKVEVAIKKDEKETVETTSQQNSEGDLRAQLSKKRAERQKLPTVNGVTTRLLQDALQNAVFNKKTKKSTKKDKTDKTKDAKLPIRLRLGVANMDVLNSSKKRKQKQV